MTHLGDRVAALVDDQLAPGDRERLLAHVAGCPQCRREVEAARLLKQRLATLQAPRPSARLTRQLVAMSEPGEPMPAERPAASWARRSRPAPTAWGPGPVAGAASAPSASRRATRLRRAATAAVSVGAATLGVAFAVGDEGGSGARPVVPPVEQFVVEHAATSGDVPLTEPVVGALTVGGAASVAPGMLTPGSLPTRVPPGPR